MALSLWSCVSPTDFLRAGVTQVFWFEISDFVHADIGSTLNKENTFSKKTDQGHRQIFKRTVSVLPELK